MLQEIAGLALFEFWIVQAIKAVFGAVRLTVPQGWALYIHLAITGAALAVVFFIDNFPEFAGILPTIERHIINATSGFEAFTAIALLLGGPPVIFKAWKKLRTRIAK